VSVDACTIKVDDQDIRLLIKLIPFKLKLNSFVFSVAIVGP
jgi:hypothetical protein